MTQIAVPDDLATRITSVAANRRCSPEELLRSIFSQIESDDALAERMLTPAEQERMLQGREQVKGGQFITEDEVDRKFEALFKELESR